MAKRHDPELAKEPVANFSKSNVTENGGNFTVPFNIAAAEVTVNVSRVRGNPARRRHWRVHH